MTVWRTLTLVLLFVVAATRGGRADESSLETRLLDRLKYLASDELNGRGVGTEGLNKAADYVRTTFSEVGLKTNLFDGGAFQEFEITLKSERGAAEHNRLVFLGPDSDSLEASQPIRFEVDTAFNPLAIGGSAAVKAELVFVGYGITAKDTDYDDYADIDVDGKVVIILRKEPRQGKRDSPFGGRSPSPNAFFSTKIENAREHGAVAVIFVNDRFGIGKARDAALKKWNAALEEIIKKRQEFQAKEGSTDEQAAKHRTEMISLVKQLHELSETLDSEHDQLLTVQGAGTQSNKPSELPVFFARRSLVDEAVKAATGKSLDALEASIDKDLQPQSALLPGWQADCETMIVTKKTTIKNVAAVLEGEGPHADETIIVGAHYDHLGNGGPGSLAPWTKAIHNGADDNASGTTALLEVARRLASRDKPPGRRIVFLAFSGEERGLLGSDYYVKHPAFPLEKTVAMVNMDMVGRLTENKLTVYGTGTAESFDSLIDETNKRYEFEITKERDGRGPSDHQTFYKAGIPVFHFYTGTHRDYHRPSDDVEKINLDGMARITQMVGDVVESLADAEAPPKFVAVQKRRRARLGAVPDQTRDVEGCALKAVVAGSPAERAGLKAGDVIVMLGASKIAGLQDLDGALRKHKPGDEVKVVVLRDDEGQELTVKLGAAGG